MVKVLVHGATGTIGGALAKQLVRSGLHKVWGTARTQEKAQALAADEIIPVIVSDSVGSPQSWQDAVRKHHIDVVVDATTTYGGAMEILEAIRVVGKERLDAAKKEGVVPRAKLGYLFTSGVWIHGDSHEQVSDLTPVGTASAPQQPLAINGGRPSWEQSILKSSDILDVAIVRPAMVYGRSSWIFDTVFAPIYEAKGAQSVQVPITEDALPCLVHADDVATGMQLIIEKLPTFAGTGTTPIFDLAGSYESLPGIIRSVARELGYKGKVEMAGPGDNAFYQALNASSNVDSSRAKYILGWQPVKTGFTQNVDVYAMAWKAAHEKK